MPGPARGRNTREKVVEINEADVLPHAAAAATQIGDYYSTFSEHLNPLVNFKSLPENLFAVPEANGDILLRYSNGEEVEFDVIGMVIHLCLEAPPGFPKASLPHFRRWIKVTVTDNPLFSGAIEASEVLYRFLALHAGEMLPQPRFLAEATQCLRPSATMLTSIETVPNAKPAVIPPLYDERALETVIRGVHGKFIFSTDNEILYFGDKPGQNGEVIRGEISPSAIKVGQIAQVRMKYRALKQDDGNFTFREHLKAIYILHHGASMDLARSLAERSVWDQGSRWRDAKFYVVGRSKAAHHRGNVEETPEMD